MSFFVVVVMTQVWIDKKGIVCRHIGSMATTRSTSQIISESVSEAVGIHRFNAPQLATFQTLQYTIACCGYLFGILATIDALQSVFVAFGDNERLTRSGVAYGQVRVQHR